jgi:nucleotide-binding universal stress UspA family protein
MSHPVIVGVDDAASTGAAVDWAADEADLRGARLHLVHAWQGEPEGPGSADADQARQSSAQMLDALVRRAADRRPELRITSGAVEVPPREALTALRSTPPSRWTRTSSAPDPRSAWWPSPGAGNSWSSAAAVPRTDQWAVSDR